MQSRDVEFCTFREARAVIMTWNAGASTPGSVRTNTFIQDAIHPEDPPEILVFGFQELVDLEDKKITASTFLPPLPFFLVELFPSRGDTSFVDQRLVEQY